MPQHNRSAVQPARSFQKEAEVETFYATIFDSICGEVKQHHLGIDVLTRNLLIEVKCNCNIEKEWAEILAQALYYQNTLVTLGERARPYIAVVDEDEVCIFEAEELRHIWANDSLFSKVKSEVSRASDAHQSNSLMEAIHSRDITCWYFCNVAEGVKKLQEIEQFDQPQQRPIQVNNVIEAFDDWEEIVRDYLKNNGIENAFIFYEDATGKGIVSSTREWKGNVLTIIFGTYGARISQIPEGQYRKFEKQWKRLDPNSKTAEEIRRRLYDLCEMDKRRSTGSFYTPHRLGKLAWERIVQHLGDQFWLDGTWRIWDNCAGIGNLQYEIIPENALQYIYLSDKGVAEVAAIQENDYFKGKCRGIFQFDWLNDYETKLPDNLRKDLQNKNIRWLFFINPPYVDAARGVGRKNDPGTSNTAIGNQMLERGMSESANELAIQFLYRIERDLGKRGYVLGLFSTPKWIAKPNTEKLRSVWKPNFCGGFVLNAKEHFTEQKVVKKEKLSAVAGGQFPILFSVLDRTSKPLGYENQDWTYEVIDKNARLTSGKKTFLLFDKDRVVFREYFFSQNKRSQNNTKELLRMSGAVIPYTAQSGKERGSVFTDKRLASNCIGTMHSVPFDYQHMNISFLTSGSNSRIYQITTENYQSVLTGFALFKSLTRNWLCNEDIFYAPYRDLTPEEIGDCMLFALLHRSNNTSYTTVKTATDTFILPNWFNPFDTEKFDWSLLSKVGKQALDELTYYCENIVKWRTLQTPYGNNKGNGVWLGLYQYRTGYDAVNKTYKEKFGVDYPNRDLYGIPHPDRFRAAIESLRQRVEALAIDLCLTAGKEITRTRDTFLVQSQRQPNLSEM